MEDKNLRPTGLDWVQLEKDMSQYHITESTWERIKRKSGENPFVPLGAAMTVGALTYGLVNFYKGEKMMQQRMMRLRVLAQLFTIVAGVSGVIWSLPKDKRNFKDFIKSGERQISD